MNLLLNRRWEVPECITGTLRIDGAQEYFTLELPLTFEGKPNAPFKTCIPAATYLVLEKFSHHFDQLMPHVMGVPNRGDIEIHIANFPKEILGCIAVGEFRISDTEIGSSRVAFEDLHQKMKSAWANNEQVWLEIQDI